jgi:hypothetical protein
MLLSWAAFWLLAAGALARAALLALGVGLAVLAWQLLFRGLAVRAVDRIERSPERACVFGFQAPRSYLIMGSMIALGTALRHSAIPKPDLAVAYVAIGGALLLASFKYHAQVLRSEGGIQL